MGKCFKHNQYEMFTFYTTNMIVSTGGPRLVQFLGHSNTDLYRSLGFSEKATQKRRYLLFIFDVTK